MNKSDFDYARTRVNDDDWNKLNDALETFAFASIQLQQAWLNVGDDGNHPIVMTERYPFGDTLFPDVSIEIVRWASETKRMIEAIRDNRLEDVNWRHVNKTEVQHA